MLSLHLEGGLHSYFDAEFVSIANYIHLHTIFKIKRTFVCLNLTFERFEILLGVHKKLFTTVSFLGFIDCFCFVLKKYVSLCFIWMITKQSFEWQLPFFTT